MSAAANYQLPKAAPEAPRRSPFSQRASATLPSGQSGNARYFSNAGGHCRRARTRQIRHAASTIQRPAKHPMPLGQRKFAGQLSRSANGSLPSGLSSRAEHLLRRATELVPHGHTVDARQLFGRPSEDYLRAFALVPPTLHSWRALLKLPCGPVAAARQLLLRISP